MIRRLALVAIVVLAATASAQPAVESTIRDFYAAYAAGDAVKAASFWSKDKAPAFELRATRTAATRCITLHRLSIDRVVVSEGGATAQIDAYLTRGSMYSGSQDAVVDRRSIALTRERGAWKIDRWRKREEELAEKLGATPNSAAQQTLLAENAELFTRDLVLALTSTSIAIANRDDLTRAGEVIALIKHLAMALDDPTAMAAALSAESILQRRNNELATAVQTARAALAFAEQSDDADVYAQTLMRLGRAEGAIAEDPLARFEQVLALADHIEDPAILALTASQLAIYSDERLRTREALHYSVLAAKYAEESGDVAAILSAKMNLGGAFLFRGDCEMGLPYLQSALSLAESSGFGSVAVRVNLMIAACTSEPQRWLAVVNRVAETVGPNSDRGITADLFGARATYWARVGDFDRAEADLQRSYDLAACVPGTQSESTFYTNRANVRWMQKRYDDALVELDRAAANGESPGGLGLRIAVLRDLGRNAEARQALEDSIDGLEQYRERIDHWTQRATFLRRSGTAYLELSLLLVEAGQHRQALMIAERMKARALKELATGSAEAKTGDAEEVSRANARVTGLNRELLAAESKGATEAAIRTRLQQARRQLNEVTVRNAIVRASESEVDFDLAAVDIPAGTVVVDYLVTEKKTIVFVLRRNRELETVSIDVDYASLQRAVSEFVRRIESRSLKYRPEARELYDLLLKPVIGDGASYESVVIVPDDVLWRVPFQALITPRDKHLLEETVVSYVPSLSSWSRPVKPSMRTPTLLAAGDPIVDARTKSDLRSIYRNVPLGRLPDAEQEVRDLRRLYGKRATILTGAAASESAIKRDVSGYAVVHLATHGIVDEHAPLYSALLLAGSDEDDGLLEAREIPSLPLDADLVVLSACNSAGGEVIKGEGLVGLSWAVLATGTPRAIATQWRVASAATAELMVSFHRRLSTYETVHDVAPTLRKAQLEMLRSGRYAHPYYWAAFILIGRDN